MVPKERDVVLQGTDEYGERTIDLPITSLRNIEDTAQTTTSPTADDYIPVVDTSEQSEMKKIKYGDLKRDINTIQDDTIAGAKYRMGVDNGGLYIEEV